MARKAQGSSALDRFTAFARDHHEEIRVGAVGAAIAFFFTHGLPLWDDDYSLWLAQADKGLFDIIKRIIMPVTSEPQNWGYSDRPMQVLFYWLVSKGLGTWGTGWFLLKSTIFGGLVGTLYHWIRKLGVDRVPAYLALAVFALSANVQAAVIWHSDFGIHSQIVLAILMMWSIGEIEKGPRSAAVYKGGWNGLPSGFKRFLITFALTTYLGSKMKGDVRLAPVILLAWMYLFRREKFNVYWAPFAAILALTLPWSGSMFRALPPFLGGSGYSGWTYGAFSLHRVWEFLAGDALTVSGPSLSLLGAGGIFLVLGVIAYGGYRLYQEKLEAPNERWSFFLIWMGVALLSCGMLAVQNPTFQLRYTLIPMVPATILLGLVTQAAMREFSRVKFFREATMAVFALQCGLHVVHDVQHRRDMGHTMVAIDKIFRVMEEQHPTASFALLPGFLPYGYKNSAVSSIANRKAIGGIDSFGQQNFPAGNSFGAAWSSTLDARMSVELSATGCGSSLFDAIFPCRPNDGAVLLKFNGQNVPELVEADRQDKAGNLAGARQAYESYLSKEPGNHGAAFVLGLVYYRLGEYAKMEQLYDKFGSFFPGHTSVLYNWGLAKQGVQKWGEAAKLLENAYAMAPKDYAIGFNLADTYFRQHKKTRALATLEELLKVYPNSDAMKKAYSSWQKDN